MRKNKMELNQLNRVNLIELPKGINIYFDPIMSIV